VPGRLPSALSSASTPPVPGPAPPVPVGRAAADRATRCPVHDRHSGCRGPLARWNSTTNAAGELQATGADTRRR
jgi:hypothetical protein